MSKNWVYFFSSDRVDGKADMLDILGGKGASLAEMSALGLPVPPGFTISAEVCKAYAEAKNQSRNDSKNLISDDLKQQVIGGVKWCESLLGKSFGAINSQKPLLVSVRSGSKISMPGMMDTVLNLGMNDEVVESLAKYSGLPEFAYDCYRRFIHMYATIVLGMDSTHFDHIYEEKTGSHQHKNLPKLDILKDLIISYKSLLKIRGHDLPEDPYEQLFSAISAVFNSWNSDRAVFYRKYHNISDDLGTAVNVQSMVFGNLSNDSATGVVFTRNPSSGEKYFFGEYLMRAQGEDIVAGTSTPMQINKRCKQENRSADISLEEAMPDVYNHLEELGLTLENHYKDIQDIEFTIESGKLWMLQTRSAKRSAMASVKIAVDMVNEGLISKDQALLRISPDSLSSLLHSQIEGNEHRDRLITKGLPASPGAVTGMAAFSVEAVEEITKSGKKAILIRTETSPEDITGMSMAVGILTARGGMTSHAAVVARGMGKCCVSSATDMRINNDDLNFVSGKWLVKEGDILTISGTTGEVIFGEVELKKPAIDLNFSTVMQWADSCKKMAVRANAETAEDLETAMKFGADGIGLCRTEHMFFSSRRILDMRRLILSNNREDRERSLARLFPYQVDDFTSLLSILQGKPITIRLLDPPLHEFLPEKDEDIKTLAHDLGLDYLDMRAEINNLREVNPMLGHRGSRLGISYPEIYSMQVESIFKAAGQLQKETGLVSNLEIMLPFIFSEKELIILLDMAKQVQAWVEQEYDIKFKVLFGTMIELPRAVLIADKLAALLDFFSFGTNDLTQTMLGISRDDSAKFLRTYIEKGILDSDPFAQLDEEGVGAVIEMAVNKARAVKPKIKLGICGEHGGNPESIRFFNKIGLDYVSCSPYRVPQAKLVVGQLAIIDKKLS